MINFFLLVGICWGIYEASLINFGAFYILLSVVSLFSLVFIHVTQTYICYIFDSPKTLMTKYGLSYYNLEYNSEKNKYLLSIYENRFFYFSTIVSLYYDSRNIENIDMYEKIEDFTKINKQKHRIKEEDEKLKKKEIKKMKEQAKKKIKKISTKTNKEVNFEEQISKL